jgi:hypothetical protein
MANDEAERPNRVQNPNEKTGVVLAFKQSDFNCHLGFEI